MSNLIPCPHPQACNVVQGHRPGSEDARRCAEVGKSLRTMSRFQLADAVSAATSRTEEYRPGEGRYLEIFTSAEFGDAHISNAFGRKYSHRWDVRMESGINDVATEWSVYSNSETPPTAEEAVFDVLHSQNSIAPYVEHDDWRAWGHSVGLEGDAAYAEYHRIDDAYVQVRAMLSTEDFRVARAAADEELFRNFEHDDDSDGPDEEDYAPEASSQFTVTGNPSMDSDDYEAEMRRAIDGLADGEDTILSDDAALSTIARMSTFANGGHGGDSAFSRAIDGQIDRDELLEAIEDLRQDPYSIEDEDFDILAHWAQHRDPSGDDSTVTGSFTADESSEQLASGEMDRIMDEASASGGVPTDGAALRAMGWIGVRMDETDNGFTRAAGGQIDRADLLSSIEDLRSRGAGENFDERDMRDLDSLERWVRTHR